MWDAADASTTAPAKPIDQWDPSRTDISFDSSNNGAKPDPSLQPGILKIGPCGGAGGSAQDMNITGIMLGFDREQ